MYPFSKFILISLLIVSLCLSTLVVPSSGHLNGVQDDVYTKQSNLFALNYNTTLQQLYQNESVSFFVKVKDKTTNVSLSNVSVSLTITKGEFSSTSTNSTQGLTNSSGIFLTDLNFSTVVFDSYYNNVNISINLHKIGYTNLTETASITVIQVIPEPVTIAQFSRLSIKAGESLTILTKSTYLKQPLVNGTIELTTSFGIFSNGKNIMSQRTDSKGESTFSFKAVNLPTSNVTKTLNNSILIRTIVNGLYFLSVEQNISITIPAVVPSSPTTTLTGIPLTLENSAIIAVISIVGVILGLMGANFITSKRKN